LFVDTFVVTTHSASPLRISESLDLKRVYATPFPERAGRLLGQASKREESVASRYRCALLRAGPVTGAAVPAPTSRPWAFKALDLKLTD